MEKFSINRNLNIRKEIESEVIDTFGFKIPKN